MHQVLLILLLTFVKMHFFLPYFTAISSNPTTMKCEVFLKAGIFQFILYAATKASS